MSITVRDCMSLPSLQLGRVAAGRKGLDVIVNSVSVIEFDDKDDPEDIFTPNELLITSLYCARGDISEQSRILVNSRRNGAVGIILFYASTIQNSLEALIETADRINLPLIIMPEDNMGLKYSDVISDVMEMLVIDRQSENSFVNNSMERIAQLQDKERNLATVLKIAGYHARASLFLADAEGRILGTSYWPADNEHELALFQADIEAGQFRSHGADQMLLPVAVAPGTRHLLRAFNLHGSSLVLHAITHNDRLSYTIIGQIVELLQLFSSVWNYPLDPASLPALVPALLEGDLIRAGHIVRAVSFPLEALTDMLIFPDFAGDQDDAPHFTNALAELNSSGLPLVAAAYGRDLVILYDRQRCAAAGADAPEALAGAGLPAAAGPFRNRICVEICGISTPEAIHDSYSLYTAAFSAARRIYPSALSFDVWKLSLAQQASELLASPKSPRATSLQRLLDPLQDRKNPDLLPTLAVYLLDADSEVRHASELLFVHRNTILYRLNQIRDRLGKEMDTLPMAYDVYLAAALWRLSK